MTEKRTPRGSQDAPNLFPSFVYGQYSLSAQGSAGHASSPKADLPYLEDYHALEVLVSGDERVMTAQELGFPADIAACFDNEFSLGLMVLRDDLARIGSVLAGRAVAEKAVADGIRTFEISVGEGSERRTHHVVADDEERTRRIGAALEGDPDGEDPELEVAECDALSIPDDAVVHAWFNDEPVPLPADWRASLTPPPMSRC